MNNPLAWHPEIKENELYVGSVTVDCYHKSNWKTKRIGIAGRNMHGGIDTGTRPMFVLRTEVQQRLADEEAKEKPCATSIKALTDLLNSYF